MITVWRVRLAHTESFVTLNGSSDEVLDHERELRRLLKRWDKRWTVTRLSSSSWRLVTDDLTRRELRRNRKVLKVIAECNEPNEEDDLRREYRGLIHRRGVLGRQMGQVNRELSSIHTQEGEIHARQQEIHERMKDLTGDDLWWVSDDRG